MEKVILVDEKNRPIGVTNKNTVHTKNTPLHRGFSLFLFNSKKELLVTKRSQAKKTFPGVWTNTICGHPGPGENIIDAARRRLNEELKIKIEKIKIKEIAPYRYRFADQNGILENEICPILVGYADITPKPQPQEAADWKWIKWGEFLKKIKKNPQRYSPWSVEEAFILEKILNL